MGQYYHGVILDAKTKKPILTTYPLFMKIVESGLWDVNRIVYELSKKGRAYKQRVTWAGDYSERKDYDGDTLYRYIKKSKVPEAMGKEQKKFPITARDFTDAWYDAYDKFFRQYVTDEKDIIREEFRYLCNHDRKEWIDLMPFYTAEERMFWNPLAILTSDPTCRCGGNGDYKFKDDFEWYGAWSDCILSSEPMPPMNYKRIAPLFNAQKPLADDDPLLESPPAPPAIESTQTFADRLRAALQKNYGEAA